MPNIDRATVSAASRTIRWAMLGTASSLALCVAAHMPARAQDAGEAADDEAGRDIITVRGIRGSLQNAQEIKQDADTFVDAVTAVDINALPDRSVAEVLQRIPGIAISRFAAGEDPDHFSVEGSSAVIRGLPYARSELNGRDTFSANSGRNLGFNDVSPELLGSVQVFKNSTADMIEGGISGTINLITRKPFDNDGLLVAGSVEANYSDFIDRITPAGSILASNTWETGAGKFGGLLSFSQSELKSRADGTQPADFCYRDPSDFTQGCIRFQSVGANGLEGDPLFTPETFPPAGSVLAPAGSSARSQFFDRDRRAISAAAQWESTDRTMLATFEYLRADATQAWTEYVIETGLDAQNPAQPAPGTAFDFDDSGTFVSGRLTSSEGWRSNINCDPGSAVGPTDPCIPLVGLPQGLNTRSRDLETTTEDLSFNFRWTPTDRLSTQFDIQRVEATTDDLDVSIFGRTYSDIFMDFSGGETPVVQYLPPATTDNSAGADWFVDPNQSFWRAAMDHIEQSEGDELAVRGDVEYDISDEGWLRSVRFGGRWAERDQTTRWSTFNWGNLSETWNGGPVFFGDTPGFATGRAINDFQRGEVPAFVDQALWYNGDLIDDYRSGVFRARTIDIQDQVVALGGSRQWRPLAERDGVIEGTPFRPGEVTETVEQTLAFYGRADFGSDNLFNSGVTLDANVGVRWVRTEVETAGTVQFPSREDILGIDPATGAVNTIESACAPPDDLPPGEDPNLSPFCDLPAARQQELIAFANEDQVGLIPDVAVNEFNNVLPSLNMKFGVTEDVIVRFGASRGINRPDLGSLRNQFILSDNLDNLERAGTLETGPLIRADAGNPFLEPIRSTNIDLSLEWYFDDVGSITGSFFYKELEDVILSSELNAASAAGSATGTDSGGAVTRQITNNGVTLDVEAVGPINAGDGEIQGFELAYQQTYDMLPAPFDGLGAQASYTYVDNSGVPNTSIRPVEGNGVQDAPSFEIALPLQNVSKHTINLIGFYETEKVQARLAYNWRSEYLLTTRDVIFPFVPIWHDSTGQLDGSLFYNVTDTFTVGVQGVNLLDEVTKTLQQVDFDQTLAPRSYFRNDRRISFVGRFRY